jgi:hypothetical protein
MGVKLPLPPWLEHAGEVKRKMKQRGFKASDRVQICEKCDEYAEESWTLRGGGQGMGGRDVAYCVNCGRSRSWKGSVGGQRVVEDPFDLLGFLGIKA